MNQLSFVGMQLRNSSFLGIVVLLFFMFFPTKEAEILAAAQGCRQLGWTERNQIERGLCSFILLQGVTVHKIHGSVCTLFSGSRLRMFSVDVIYLSSSVNCEMKKECCYVMSSTDLT